MDPTTLLIVPNHMSFANLRGPDLTRGTLIIRANKFKWTSKCNDVHVDTFSDSEGTGSQRQQFLVVRRPRT